MKLNYTIIMFVLLIGSLGGHTQGTTNPVDNPSGMRSTDIKVNTNVLTNYTQSTPNYIWLNAAKNGQSIDLSGDDVQVSFQLPFTFTFYGQPFTSMNISSNGWMSFNETDVTSTHETLPIFYSYVIAPYWRDLIATNDVYAIKNSQYVWLEFSNITDYDLGIPIGSFAVMLQNDGGISFYYNNLSTIGSSNSTIGLNYGVDQTIYNVYPEFNGTTQFALGYNFQHPLSGILAGVHTNSLALANNTQTVTATIKNLDQSIVDVAQLYLYINDELVAQSHFSNIAAGGSVHLEYEWTPNHDITYNITAYATPLSNELITVDNQASTLIHLSQLPDYSVQTTAYTWYNGNTTGYQPNLYGDDVSINVSLPFDFTFYGKTFNTVNISSNGYISFNDTDPTLYSNLGFPAKTADITSDNYNYMIAPFWDDLEMSNTTYVVSDNSNYVAIEFDNAVLLDTGDLIGNFSVVLFQNGNIQFNYQYINATQTPTPTIGVNLGDGYHGAQYQKSIVGVTEFALLFSVAPTMAKLGDQVFNVDDAHKILTWLVGSDNPNNYSLSVDGVQVVSDTWTTSSISFDMSSYSVGVYQLNFTIRDTNGNVITNTFTVTIQDTTTPTITTSGDLTYTEGTTGNTVEVTVSDDTNGFYVLYQNGTEIDSGNYTANKIITVNVDGLSVGVYNFTAAVTDLGGNHASASLTITVNAVPSSTSSSTPSSSSNGSFLDYSTGFYMLLISLPIVYEVLKRRKRTL